ncbi:hypothetical protein INQ42_05830 [Lysobacter avium]|uniref:STAS/SEC14 domain-containing protein n=2 Tax=Novilysobacter avium TaxID=2781023 RepID=A0A7S6UMJ6_9GAMM|nr:hypothetical protein [Lysobacter sp. H23M47]QOW23067.1 hypothetical protein INQ42_05830 [Lysobacter avium]
MEPEPSTLIVNGSSFQIEFRRDGNRLRASVTGVTGSLEVSREYWALIAREAMSAGVPMLLVIDSTVGGSLTLDELEQFIHHLSGLGLEKVRTAYVGVDTARSWQNETTEILARERGFVARVFEIESEASLWLRHGEL